jgi:deoxyribose-phosphate aldolase
MIKDVQLIKKVIPQHMRIKVAGGIKTTKEAKAFLKAGADRIGTSKAIEIVKGA